MLDLTDTQRADTQQRRCFFAPDEKPGWERFYSADPRFPLTIALPNGMLQMVGSCRFHTFEQNSQELIFDDGVGRAHPTWARLGRQFRKCFRGRCIPWIGAPPTRRPSAGIPTEFPELLEGGKPGCVVYGNGAVRVWFETLDQELWSFERQDDFPDTLFVEILTTTRWLSKWYFAELPTSP